MYVLYKTPPKYVSEIDHMQVVITVTSPDLGTADEDQAAFIFSKLHVPSTQKEARLRSLGETPMFWSAKTPQ